MKTSIAVAILITTSTAVAQLSPRKAQRILEEKKAQSKQPAVEKARLLQLEVERLREENFRLLKKVDDLQRRLKEKGVQVEKPVARKPVIIPIDKPVPLKALNQIALGTAICEPQRGYAVLTFDVRNDSNVAVRRVYLRAIVRDPGRAVPYIDVHLAFTPAGGIEPHETRGNTQRLHSNWIPLEARPADIKVIGVAFADGSFVGVTKESDPSFTTLQRVPKKKKRP